MLRSLCRLRFCGRFADDLVQQAASQHGLQHALGLFFSAHDQA